MYGRKRQHAFTLVEVLVSLSVFAIGMLGIGLSLTKGLKNVVHNDVHSAAMRVVQQEVEPLHIAVQQGRARLQTALNAASTTQIIAEAPLQGRFSVSVNGAMDRNGLDLLSADTAVNWAPPYTVVLEVVYNGPKGQLKFPTAHVLVPELEAPS